MDHNVNVFSPSPCKPGRKGVKREEELGRRRARHQGGYGDFGPDHGPPPRGGNHEGPCPSRRKG